jgi:hypothetical protein
MGFCGGIPQNAYENLKNPCPEAIMRFLQIRHTNPHPNSDLPKLMEVLRVWVLLWFGEKSSE